MVRLALIFTVILQNVYGQPPLPPLPMKGGCYLVSPEVEIYRVEGEAVIVSFPLFKRVLEVRNIVLASAEYLILKDNGTEGVTFQGQGRVQQHDKQLWFLPAHVSDSGKYICTYRNATYCVTGSITLHVYESSFNNMEKLSYPISATVGEYLRIPCPSLSSFNKTERLIEWHKDSSPTALQLGRNAGLFRQNTDKLIIPTVKRSHGGTYTCQLTVLINDKQYKVSRAIMLHVQGSDPTVTTTVPDFSMTTDSELISTAYIPILQPPVIISPLNGTVFESPHGSGLELICKVLTDCQMAESTVVTWLVDGQSVESPYLDRWTLQGGKRVTRVSEGCQIEMRLIVVSMTEDDVKTELKCVTQNQGGRQEVVIQLQLEDSTFTWIVVATVAVSCFLTVASVFLYAIFKPKMKKKTDYILARQNSTF
ncbi:interleukin-1 receptor type 2 isoform X2 [Mastacembelus armatus]|uniref:interleukin-1 receptor type 2 isoform X2 n=1 Tax=Mastacembelus armatus TaxID=205130 RepID=UPI000E4601A1|nr:interleukin-1 receptor type 2 isoform X2 [Mastacembelus armatus]